jgi:hypothetical protein
VAALGRSLPYFFRFPYGSPTEYVPFVAGFSIVTSSAASAHAAFQYAGGLVSAVTADETVRPQPIRSLSLGQGAELFSQTLRSPCPAPPPQCPASENFGTGYAVVWWDGPTLGVVEVQGVPFDRQALAIRLARRQWTRRYAIHF